MKIIQIQFKNINNLKGEHRISFDELPLSTAGIFAIVGPTGSGKSTILDVITLALFNRIPRFSRPISKGEISKEGSVVTHHTTEASASIDYVIKGKKYKSSWSVETNRNGKLKDYEMTFYNPDGSIADLKRSQVPAQNEMIIGLKYEQFVKSILLSQGEFSKFLKADKNERGALLENLTGTSIYRTIGIKAYHKYKQAKEHIDIEKKLIGELSTLEEEDRQRLETELNLSKKEKGLLDAALASLTNLLHIKTDIHKINATLAIKQKEAADIKQQTLAFQADQVRLDIHQKLSHVQGSLATYNDAVANAKKSQENLKQYKTELEVAKSKHQAAIDEMSELTQQVVTAESFKQVMTAFEAEINTADINLENLKNKGRETRARINSQKSNYHLTLDDSIKAQDAIARLTERATQLQTVISAAKIDLTKPLTEIKKELKENQEEFKRLNTIKSLYQTIEELNAKIVTEKNKLKDYTQNIKTNTPLVDKCQVILESTNHNIALLIRQKEDAIKITKLEEFRDTLISGEACPLCGSLEHPYAEHNPEPQQSAIDAQINQAQATLKENQRDLNAVNTILAESKTALDLTQQVIDQTSQELSTLKKTCEEESSNISNKSIIDKDHIAQTIDLKTSQIESTEMAIDAITEAKQNTDLTEQYQQLQKISTDYSSLKKNRDSKFSGPDINTMTNRLQDAFEQSKSDMTRLTAVIKIDEESLKRDKNLVTSIQQELQPKINQLGFSDIAEISAKLLDESTLINLTQQRDRLNKQQTRIDTEIKTLIEEQSKKRQLETNPDTTLEALQVTIQEKKDLIDQHQNIFITNLERIKRDDEDRKKIKAKEQALAALNKEFDKWSLLNKMIGDATGNSFANFAQGLTLQNLLVYANRRLSNLSDRYLIDKPENEGALVVIDKYQGNTSRSVNTLSGGESFLISLALALSLSDMASKNVALDCLFIDEGFGTLDPDTLELAMTTLEKLQSESQKTVGVISHVEALKERIHVQIKLNKNTQGYSQIEIVS